MNLTHTISAIEVLWTGVCFLGFIFCLRRFRRVVELLAYLREKGINEFREYAVATKVLSYGTYTFVQFAFVLIGIAAMIAPPPPGSTRAGPLSYIVGVGFIMISFLLAVVSYILDARDVQLENKIMKSIQRREKEHEHG